MPPKVLQIILNFDSNRTTYKELFGCLGIDLCNVWWFVFFEVSTFFILGGCNFFVFNPFLIIVSVLDAPRGGVQILFGH
jgi:hypothetical protein